MCGIVGAIAQEPVALMLLEALRDEYDVVIHQDAFASPPPSK